MLVWLSVWRARCRLVYGQLMPLPLTVSCFSKIQIGFTFLVPAHLGSPGQRAVTRVCVCVEGLMYMCLHVFFQLISCLSHADHLASFITSVVLEIEKHIWRDRSQLSLQQLYIILCKTIYGSWITHIMTWLITMGSGGISRGPSRVGISENFIREHSRICVQNTLD